jgi:hypothetical protein
MSRDAGQMAAFGPAAVSVHDDSDVVGQPLRIEAGVNLGLFAVQPSGHLCAQSVPLTILESSTGHTGLQRNVVTHFIHSAPPFSAIVTDA